MPWKWNVLVKYLRLRASASQVLDGIYWKTGFLGKSRMMGKMTPAKKTMVVHMAFWKSWKRMLPF